MEIERSKYHEWQDRFKSYLDKGCLLYDVGKSGLYDYKEKFAGYNYKTVDKLGTKNPDIFIDLEGENCSALEMCDAFIMNGVTEQCLNPFKLLKNLTSKLKPNGYALFGIISVGFPLYEWDYLRFTPNGIWNYLKDFNVVEKEIIYRENLPSYVFVIGRKK